MFQPFKDAVADLREAVAMHSVWRALAKEDITDQHRRTTLGPLWILLNYLLLVGTFYVIFGSLTPIENFIAYVATAFLVWTFLSEVMTQSVGLFFQNKPFITGTVLPLSVYILRMTAQSLTRLCYTLSGCAVLVLLSGAEISIAWFYSLLALIIIILSIPAIIAVLSVLGAFFPDLQFLIQNAMRVGMFLTPIFWATDRAIGLRHTVYVWNPFTYVIEMFRSPIMTAEPHLFAFILCLVMSVALWILGLFLLGRYRERIVYMI